MVLRNRPPHRKTVREPVSETAPVKRQEGQSAQEYARAMQANQTSDTYVLLTVLFASVLFFGGIAGTVDSRRCRISIMTKGGLMLLMKSLAQVNDFVCNRPPSYS